ncbi:MAG: hypothetical protein EBW84_12135 [Betaproteobacteria bacterium]|nr:hypothetical protein [Betaproteobacteria bacterium]
MLKRDRSALLIGGVVVTESVFNLPGLGRLTVDSVLARYRERNITVIQSPGCGAAAWQSSQPQKVLCQRELSRRYWQHTDIKEAQ